MQRPPDPPDPSTPERKYRSRLRSAAGVARSDPSTALTQSDAPHAKRESLQPEPQGPPPRLVRSGTSSTVQRVDILIPRPPPPPRPPSSPSQPGKPRTAGTPPRSRIQRDRKERGRKGRGKKPLRLTKGFWVSLLIGVIGVAAVITLGVMVRGWVGDFRAEQEETKRAEAERAERASHPIYFQDLIERYAQRNALDPALVAAVILCESSFNPDARSNVNARGLMQIMPDTAHWIVEMTGESNFSLERLHEAELNVRMGTWYLNFLANEFDNNLRNMICGYHAGQGRVREWLSKPEYSPDGVTMSVIPYDDTAGYEARVQRAILAYQKYHFSE